MKQRSELNGAELMNVQNLRLGLLQVLADVKLQAQEPACDDQCWKAEGLSYLIHPQKRGIVDSRAR